MPRKWKALMQVGHCRRIRRAFLSAASDRRTCVASIRPQALYFAPTVVQGSTERHEARIVSERSRRWTM
jgi:hypothetical protein